MSSVQPSVPVAPLTIRRSADAAATAVATSRLRTASVGTTQRLAAGPTDATGWMLAMAAAGSSDTTLQGGTIASAGSGSVSDSAHESVRAYVDAQFRVTSAVRDTLKKPIADLQAAAAPLTRSPEGNDVMEPAMVVAAVKVALEDARKMAVQASDDVKAVMVRGATEAGELATRIAQWNGVVAAQPDRVDLQRRQEGLAVRLTRLVGSQSARADDGTLDVSIGATGLVKGTRSTVVEPRRDGVAHGSSWSVDGAPVAVQGELGAVSSTLHRVLPDLSTSLDDVALALQQIERAPQGSPEGNQALHALNRAIQEVGAWADGVEQSARGAGRVATMAHVLGKVFSVADPGLLHDALFSAPQKPDLSDESVSRLQEVNQSFAALGRHVTGTESVVPSGATAISSNPEHVHAQVNGVTAPATLDVTVLSIATGPTVAASRTVGKQEVLAGENGARLEFLIKNDGEKSRHVVDIPSYPRIEDVASAINNSGAQVRATMVKMGGSAYQLRVTSLSTGRSTDVVVTDGQQPPSTSTIMGKFNALESARETIAQIEITSGGDTGTRFVASPDRQLRDVWPGVTLTATGAPEDTATIHLSQDATAGTQYVESVVQAARDTVTTARAAATSLPPDEARMVGSAVQAVVGETAQSAVPGLAVQGRGTHATFEWNATHFAAALREDPVATARAVQSQLQGWADSSRRASDPATGSIPERLRWAAPGATAGDLRTTLGTEDVQAAARKQATALHQSLRQLSVRGDWLQSQLQTVGADV